MTEKYSTIGECVSSGRRHLDAGQFCTSSVSAFRVHAESHFGLLLQRILREQPTAESHERTVLVASENSEEAVMPHVHECSGKAVFGGNSRLQDHGIILDIGCGL